MVMRVQTFWDVTFRRITMPLSSGPISPQDLDKKTLTGQGLGLPQITHHPEVLIPHWTDLMQCSFKLKHLLI